MDKDYADPQTVNAALAEWEAVFKMLPRVDAVFVPGGDPGHTEPKYLSEPAAKAEGRLAQVPSQGADVGFASILHRGLDGRILLDRIYG